MRALHWLWKAVEAAQRIMLPREGERLGGKEALQNADGLFETPDPNAGWVKPHTCLVIFGLREAGTKPQLDTPVQQHVKRRDLLGQDHRMPAIIREDHRSDPQSVCRVGNRR